MIPDYKGNNAIQNQGINITKTYFLDRESKRIRGLTSGKKAMEQAILKILSTKRYEFEIYNWDYGSQLHNLIGESKVKAEMMAEEYIEDALLCDSRIEKIENFSISVNNKNTICISFEAITKAGIISIETEADIIV